MIDGTEQFIVEMKDLGPRLSAVRRSSVLMCPSSFDSMPSSRLETSALIAFPMALANADHGLILMGGDLYQGHQNQGATRSRSAEFL